jgi:translation initiation factor 1 (eIF-1/SUI1)
MDDNMDDTNMLIARYILACQESQIVIKRINRQKRKFVTAINGLQAFGTSHTFSPLSSNPLESRFSILDVGTHKDPRGGNHFAYPSTGVDMKKTAKVFANKFATGASVAANPQGEDEVVIQGDVAYEVPLPTPSTLLRSEMISN